MRQNIEGESKMSYYVVMATRTSDGAVWMSILGREKDAQELAELIREGNDLAEGVLLMEVIEVDHINFL